MFLPNSFLDKLLYNYLCGLMRDQYIEMRCIYYDQ